MSKQNNNTPANVVTESREATTEAQQYVIPPNVVTVEIVEYALSQVISRLELHRGTSTTAGHMTNLGDVYATIAHDINFSLRVCEHCGRQVDDLLTQLVHIGRQQYCNACMQLPAQTLYEAHKIWCAMEGHDVERDPEED